MGKCSDVWHQLPVLGHQFHRLRVQSSTRLSSLQTPVTSSGIPLLPQFENLLELFTELREALYLQLKFCCNKRIQIRTSERRDRWGEIWARPKHEASEHLLWSPGWHYLLLATMCANTRECCQAEMLTQVSGVQSFYWGSVTYCPPCWPSSGSRNW